MENARTFTARLADLLARERSAMGEFLVALAEFDRQRLWLALGYGSLFAFLHRELGLSKGAAFYRKAAIELIQKFPEVVEPIRDGRLCLMSLAEVARVLTPENRETLLPRFFRLSKREAQALAVSILPRESQPRREVVTTVRAAAPALALAMPAAAPERAPVQPVELERPSAACAGETAARTEPDFTQGGLTGQTSACQLEAAAPRGTPPRAASDAPQTSSEPLTADLSRFHVTVSRRFLEKLEKARAALSHSHPGAGADEILEAGLDLLLERQEKRRGIVAKPRTQPPPSSTDHVPAHVKRAVWKRDGGRCQWKLDGGGVCGSTHQLQIDHVVPRGRGGPSTVENLRILCAVHNDLAARQVYGDDWMDLFTGRGAGTSAGTASPARGELR
jgi:5-methylcytosine-specific restriction endonuclease McrA